MRKGSARALYERILDYVYPPRCPVCDRVADFRLRIHPACEKWLPLVKEPRCKKCSKPLSNKEDEYCFDCGRKHFSYESGIALYVYNAKMSDSMSALKYKNRKEYGSFYGHRLGKLCRKEILRMHPEAIVPVPVHPVRERRRGYNQAQVIAEALSEEIGVPVLANALIRTKKTMPQKELDDKGRLRNLLEAFGMREGCPDVSGRTLLLVDDIYTTGSTIEACTRVLLHAGAKRVYFATVCIGNGF